MVQRLRTKASAEQRLAFWLFLVERSRQNQSGRGHRVHRTNHSGGPHALGSMAHRTPRRPRSHCARHACINLVLGDFSATLRSWLLDGARLAHSPRIWSWQDGTLSSRSCGRGGCRSEQAHTVHKVMTRLSGSSLTRLLGLSLRPQRGDTAQSPGRTSAEASTGQQGVSAGPPTVPAGTPLTPILLNPGQICYANAHAQLRWLLQNYSSHPRPYGRLQAAFAFLKPAQRTSLLTCLPWTAIVRAWFQNIGSNMRTQQDAARFLDYLLQAASTEPLV